MRRTLIWSALIGIGLSVGLVAPSQAAMAPSSGPCVVGGVHVLSPRGGGAIVTTPPDSGIYTGCPSDVRNGAGGRVELGVLGPCVLVGVSANSQSVSTDRDTGVYLECPTEDPAPGE